MVGVGIIMMGIVLLGIALKRRETLIAELCRA